MWPFTSCDDDGCRPPDPNAITIASIIAASPFGVVLFVSTLIAVQSIYPRLSKAAQDEDRDGEDHQLPSHAPAELRQAHAAHGAKSVKRRSVAWTFAVTVGLATTLASLILAEIVELVSSKGRNLALRITVPALLFVLVVVIPWLECQSLLTSAGWNLQRTARGTLPRIAWTLQMTLFGGWLFAFWRLGGVVPDSGSANNVKDLADTDMAWSEILTRACLERIGVVGITLMALLAGFASVSAPWHAFMDDSKRKSVSEADVSRKQSGLDATREMLIAKKHKLQAITRKLEDPGTATSGSFMGRMMGTLRGASSEETEMKNLKVEIEGLQTMEANLASTLSLMKGRKAMADRGTTAFGRLLITISYGFSVYCVYRVIATTLTTLRRTYTEGASFSSSDPINRVLGLLARHWDPKLDQLAWARIISFVLSGVILVASANSAVQTFHLFAKWTPGLLRHALGIFSLAVGQIFATYVISASLLMRSQLPHEAKSAVGGVLRGALTPQFVDSWFEGWFLLGSLLTGVGLWMGKKFGNDEDWDDYSAEEMGMKQH